MIGRSHGVVGVIIGIIGGAGGSACDEQTGDCVHEEAARVVHVAVRLEREREEHVADGGHVFCPFAPFVWVQIRDVWSEFFLCWYSREKYSPNETQIGRVPLLIERLQAITSFVRSIPFFAQHPPSNIITSRMYLCRTAYEGQKTKDGKRFHGRGLYVFANGDKYVGEMHDGAMHGPGILFFSAKNGSGQYRGVWHNGKNISGEFSFADGLQYNEDPTQWTHCTLDDRRMWQEYLEFVAPAKQSLSEPVPPHLVRKHGAEVAKMPDFAVTKLSWTTPDYSTTDGIPAVFADKQPRSVAEVPLGAYFDDSKPHNEHEVKKAVGGTVPAATSIAQVR
jgi:hypothetical protein